MVNRFVLNGLSYHGKGAIKEIVGILTAKGIDHWADFWGFDVNHDWPWWQKQLPYFMGHVLGEA